MNKARTDYRKQIIRNPEGCIPKSVLIQQLPTQTKEVPKDVKPSSSSEKSEILTQKCEITAPKLNSALCVKKKMKEVEGTKPRKIKSLSDLPQPERVTFDEQITKKVNFPFDQKLYKQLISLKLVEKPVLHTVPVSHEPVYRDKVPRLEDFFTPSIKPEYSIPVTTALGPHSTTRHYNGMRLYQVTRTWISDRPD